MGLRAERYRFINIIALSVLLIIVNGLFAMAMYRCGCEFQGNDIYGHLFRIQSLLDAWDKGISFPYYTPLWYNTVELFRYWPPLPYYFCAILAKATGSLIAMYFLFVFSVNMVASFGWLVFGIARNRSFLGFFLACLWLFLPDNLRVLFSEGNIPRLFIGAFIPWLIFAVLSFYETRKMAWLIMIAILSAMLVASHVMITAMIGVSMFIFGFIHACCYKNWKQFGYVLYMMIAGMMSAGWILLPSLIGGITTQTSEASSATSADWSQSFFQSFNPFTWHSVEHIYYYYYFGFSLLVITVLGLCVMHRRTATLFGTVFIIFIGTSLSASIIIAYLPMSQLFWMTRLIPIAEAFAFTGFLYWHGLKRQTIWLFIALLCLDCILAARLFKEHRDNNDQIVNKMEEEYLLKDACSITDSRMAFMDLSETNSYPSYVAIKYNAPYLFGWAYQGAATIKEIVFLNEAFENGHYTYVFDRLIEYGCDTVVVPKEKLYFPSGTLLMSAQKTGYRMVKENEKAYLFKLSGVEGTYGTVNEYRNVCIGDGSEYISFLYPSFYKLPENCLDRYTFEDLVKYDKIFVSGPDYEDKAYCEQMLDELADAGVKICIDMSNLKIDSSTGRSSFLGAVAHPITFTESFPILTKNNGSQFRLDPEAQGFDQWTTTYFTNLPNARTKKAMYSKDKGLSYLGYSDNGNITFLGLNLVFYCANAPEDNTDLYALLDEIFQTDRQSVCDRRIVPINIEYNADSIEINAPAGANTSIAILDGMMMDTSDTFIVSEQGRMRAHIHHAHEKKGIILVAIGILMMVCGLIRYKKKEGSSAQTAA